ncbi:winged helix-turn-helix domain-containing protein [Streptomyces sp. NPDC059009]|uniref:winged helix-turn-helix domain-containing protein n=1 Tax=Streptomyces sp. NPDC059009 TaxID=3346694 RepID=UPI0036B393EA
MLRIHFTEQDLARVQLASAPDPMWETVLALFRLGPGSRGREVFRPWREAALRRLGGSDCALRRQRSLLRTIVSDRSTYFPDFLTPAMEVVDISHGLAAVQDTSPLRLSRDMRFAVGLDPALPRWCHEAADGDRERLDDVAEAMRGMYELMVAPEWDRVSATVESDRSLRSRAHLEAGVDGLLNSLRPALTWDYPELTAEYPVPWDVHLNGRGLRLIPSYFCWRTPVTLVDPMLPPVVVYPIDRGVTWGPGLSGKGHRAGLFALLTRRRALILEAARSGPSTGEIARLLRIPAASAEAHLRVLRDAGLVCTNRQGPHSHHTLTGLGRALLDNELPPPPYQP